MIKAWMVKTHRIKCVNNVTYSQNYVMVLKTKHCTFAL